jgi:branched-chain amino acid transport system substrate-binding protein
MKFTLWIMFGLLALTAVNLRAYEEKIEPQNKEKDNGNVGVPLSPAALEAAAKTNGAAAPAGSYPYYANTPEEMIPYRNIEPYYRYWTTRLPFRGPGRDFPDPTDLKALKVGVLSPARNGPEGPRGQRTRKGILLAFEEENAARKLGQLPFELVEREDAPLWGSAANIAVDFKDNDVLGFLGTVDGDATHVALRAALKLETYMINTSDPDPTLTETQIPWLTRIFPEDRQQCYRLADLVVRRRGCKRIAILRESSRPGRVGIMHFVNDIRRLGCPAVAHLLYQAGDRSLAEQLDAIKGANPDAVLFYGQPEDIGFAAALFRKAGITAQYFGFDRLKEDGFAKNAGLAAEGTTITYFFNPERTDKPWVDFVGRFQARWNEKPDIYAAYGYDGAKLMIEAINKSGPNRFRIRDYLANLDAWEGVTGHMVFDARWDNIVPVSIAQYKQGNWQFQPAPAITKLDQAKAPPK